MPDDGDIQVSPVKQAAAALVNSIDTARVFVMEAQSEIATKLEAGDRIVEDRLLKEALDSLDRAWAEMADKLKSRIVSTVPGPHKVEATQILDCGHTQKMGGLGCNFQVGEFIYCVKCATVPA